MTKLLFSSIVVFFLTVVFIRSIYASLIINEIYPAPATGDYEWVELYNNDQASADLTKYILTDLANNKIKINEATLSASSYFVASCSSILNNSGDTVFLKKINGEIIEIATYSGTFTSDKSYTKCSDDNWLTTNIITKNFSNETACLPFTPTLTLTPGVSIEPTAISEPIPVSYDNIFLSEVYPYPNTGENEWVEIYNNNDFSVELVDWYFDDIENGGSSPKSITLTIEAKNYVILDLTSSIFNNSGDGVRLLDFNKFLKDSFEYTGGEKGKSWARNSFDSDEFCQQEPTKNSINGNCINSPLPTVIVTLTLNHQISTITSPPSPLRIGGLRRINQPIIIPTSSPQILGTTNNISVTKNNYQSLTKTFSFIAFSNSLLTIGSILLKIKIHEAIKLFS